jgi:hypothetical protein
MNLVTYECGCIGSLNGILVKPCSPFAKLGFNKRGRPSETYTELTDSEHTAFYKEISDLIADGYRFRRIKQLLSGGGVVEDVSPARHSHRQLQANKG